MMRRLADLPTPCLVLDRGKLQRNLDAMARAVARNGVALRPHLKTAKSAEVARLATAGQAGGITVSTLAEAEYFARHGFRDILYAVGIAPRKLARVAAIRARGCDLSVILDAMDQARAVADASRTAGHPIPALIEIDSDGHRGGLAPDDPAIVAIARHLHENGAEMRGVVTHAGESYGVSGRVAHAAFAGRERDAVVAAARALRAAGLPCPVVSVGSTPTAHAADDLTGVTELRAGVYVFFDLVMAGIGACTTDDIACSVLTSVIGRNETRGWILIDAGWMALSRDRGTAAQAIDQFYGTVCDEGGRAVPDLVVLQANQEHGIVARRPGTGGPLPDLPVGTLLRILPNHACATAAQHDRYHVIPETAGAPLLEWSRFGGW